MTLGQMQRLYTLNLAKLIIWAYEQGYELTLGEGYDDDGVGHMKGSTHYVRLGQDLNLFKDGEWLKKTEDHARLGAAWKALHPLNRWGGDFKSKDGNHYSMLWENRA
jgi:hypothetical protein